MSKSDFNFLLANEREYLLYRNSEEKLSKPKRIFDAFYQKLLPRNSLSLRFLQNNVNEMVRVAVEE